MYSWRKKLWSFITSENRDLKSSYIFYLNNVTHSIEKYYESCYDIEKNWKSSKVLAQNDLMRSWIHLYDFIVEKKKMNT